VRLTLATLDAVVRLTVTRHHSVQRDKILAAMLAILTVAHTHRQRSLVLTFIIMYEDGRDIDTIRTRHAILTIVAWYILKPDNLLCHLIVEISHLHVR
jgi:hypothetical protein